MSATDTAYTVALTIGALIVAWCAGVAFWHERRITRLETKRDKCKCSEGSLDA